MDRNAPAWRRLLSSVNPTLTQLDDDHIEIAWLRFGFIVSTKEHPTFALTRAVEGVDVGGGEIHDCLVV